MLSFFVRRIGEALVLIVVVTFLVFALMAITSQNVARSIVGITAPQSAVDDKTIELGLDQPLVVRYTDWLLHAARGDFGASWFSNNPVLTLVGNKVPVTFSLVVAAVILSAVLSLIMGVVAAVRGGWVDRALQVGALVGFAIPGFLIGLFLALVFAVQLAWFPAVGFVPFSDSPQRWLLSITLPTVAIAVQAIAATSLQVRGSMIDVLRSDFVRTLRSRGISPASLYLRHALRTAAPPALTVLGLQCVGLIGGTIIIERVFGLPGLGTSLTSASSVGDVPIVMCVVSLMVLIIVLINLVIDVAYAALNPKVRVG